MDPDRPWESKQVMGGFDWPHGKGISTLTVFSASNYAGKTCNKGAFVLLGSPHTNTRGGVANLTSDRYAALLCVFPKCVAFTN